MAARKPRSDDAIDFCRVPGGETFSLWRARYSHGPVADGPHQHGLLCGKDASGPQSFSPSRVQLLVLTLAAAGDYIRRLYLSAGTGELPDLPQIWLYVLGGSHATYLGSKWWQFIGTTMFKGATE